MSRGLSFAKVIDALEKHHGRPPALPVTTALGLVLWENVAQEARPGFRHAGQARRDGARRHPHGFARGPLRRRGVGWDAPRASRFDFDHDRRDRDGRVRRQPRGLPRAIPSSAKRALKKFPGIGDPGAEKILLFTETHPVLALESNGLRVLLRFGFGEEQKDYAASYRSVRAALEGQLPNDCKKLIRAHQLLRLHGKELCKRAQPICEACPLRARCRYASN